MTLDQRRHRQSKRGKSARRKYAASIKGVANGRKCDERRLSGSARNPGVSQRWKKENPVKVLAHQAIYRATTTGGMAKAAGQRCSEQGEHCKGVASGYHHDNYDKPLEVRPVCNPCNTRIGS